MKVNGIVGPNWEDRRTYIKWICLCSTGRQLGWFLLAMIGNWLKKTSWASKLKFNKKKLKRRAECMTGKINKKMPTEQNNLPQPGGSSKHRWANSTIRPQIHKTMFNNGINRPRKTFCNILVLFSHRYVDHKPGQGKFSCLVGIPAIYVAVSESGRIWRTLVWKKSGGLNMGDRDLVWRSLDRKLNVDFKNGTFFAIRQS